MIRYGPVIGTGRIPLLRSKFPDRRRSSVFRLYFSIGADFIVTRGDAFRAAFSDDFIAAGSSFDFAAAASSAAFFFASANRRASSSARLRAFSTSMAIKRSISLFN